MVLQIEILDEAGAAGGVRVVTAAKEAKFQPTIYLLADVTCLDQPPSIDSWPLFGVPPPREATDGSRGEVWTPLSRGPGKSGIGFRLLRPVLTVQ